MKRKCKELGVNVALSEVWAKGGEGGIALAEEVIRLCRSAKRLLLTAYELEGSIEEKLDDDRSERSTAEAGVVLTANAKKQAKQLDRYGIWQLPDLRGKDTVQLIG